MNFSLKGIFEYSPVSLKNKVLLSLIRLRYIPLPILDAHIKRVTSFFKKCRILTFFAIFRFRLKMH